MTPSFSTAVDEVRIRIARAGQAVNLFHNASGAQPVALLMLLFFSERGAGPWLGATGQLRTERRRRRAVPITRLTDLGHLGTPPVRAALVAVMMAIIAIMAGLSTVTVYTGPAAREG
jgi:hypothetical protein